MNGCLFSARTPVGCRGFFILPLSGSCLCDLTDVLEQRSVTLRHDGNNRGVAAASADGIDEKNQFSPVTSGRLITKAC